MDIPLYIYVIDYVLGVIMYTLIGRSAMNIFQKEDSEFFFMKVFVKFTNPILDFFKFLTPSFLFKCHRILFTTSKDVQPIGLSTNIVSPNANFFIMLINCFPNYSKKTNNKTII